MHGPRRALLSSLRPLLALALLGAPGCERRPSTRETAQAPPAVGTTELTSSELEQPDPADVPRGASPLAVEGEPTSFVIGAPRATSPRILYFHGMCSDAEDTLLSFEKTARAHGGVLGLTGDKACPGDLHSFTVDPERQQQRIDAALSARAGQSGAEPRPPEVVIGYSQGATLAERLAASYRYPFVVLIGSPREPSADNLANARAVVMISGENDMAKPKMKAAREACEAAGIPAHYIEMPGARHGELPDADAVIGEALVWMRDHARPAP